MTAARARAHAPRLAPALSLAPRSHPELPARDFAAEVEIIPTACGRLVERRKQDSRSHLYQLWEPAVAGNHYGTTRVIGGKAWGLAHTRRSDKRADVVEAIEHELREQRRAMDVLRRTVRELARRDAQGRPGGVAECIYEARGDVLLFSDPEVCFRLAGGAR